MTQHKCYFKLIVSIRYINVDTDVIVFCFYLVIVKAGGRLRIVVVLTGIRWAVLWTLRSGFPFPPMTGDRPSV